MAPNTVVSKSLGRRIYAEDRIPCWLVSPLRKGPRGATRGGLSGQHGRRGSHLSSSVTSWETVAQPLRSAGPVSPTTFLQFLPSLTPGLSQRLSHHRAEPRADGSSKPPRSPGVGSGTRHSLSRPWLRHRLLQGSGSVPVPTPIPPSRQWEAT